MIIDIEFYIHNCYFFYSIFFIIITVIYYVFIA